MSERLQNKSSYTNGYKGACIFQAHDQTPCLGTNRTWGTEECETLLNQLGVYREAIKSNC